MNKILFTSVILALLALSYFVGKKHSSTTHEKITVSDTIRTTDTITIFDTIRIKEPKPYYVEVVRTDTLVINDTVKVPIPIEQKTYKTEDYRAVIQGYKPTLLSMDLYKKETLIRDTLKITNTITKVKHPRFALTLGTGVAYDGRRITPYIGVGVGVVLWSK